MFLTKAPVQWGGVSKEWGAPGDLSTLGIRGAGWIQAGHSLNSWSDPRADHQRMCRIEPMVSHIWMFSSKLPLLQKGINPQLSPDLLVCPNTCADLQPFSIAPMVCPLCSWRGSPGLLGVPFFEEIPAWIRVKQLEFSCQDDPGSAGEGSSALIPPHAMCSQGLEALGSCSEIPWAPYGAFDISSSSPCLDCLSQFLCASCGEAEIINLCCALCSMWGWGCCLSVPEWALAGWFFFWFNILNWSVHLLRKEKPVIYLLILLFFLLVSHESLIFN